MLRQLTILVDGKKKSIAIDPLDITFIEEISPKQCKIAIMVLDKEWVYVLPCTFKYIYGIYSMAQFEFMEN